MWYRRQKHHSRPVTIEPANALWFFARIFICSNRTGARGVHPWHGARRQRRGRRRRPCFGRCDEGSRVLTGLDATTDEFGAFSITGLAAGEYRVSAEKREVGYLSTRQDIFNAKQPLTIVLTPDTPVVTAIIRFRAKAATITGWVRDSVTGMPIAAHLSLGPADGSGWSGTGTTARFKFSLQIPADTPVNFGACAEGYKLCPMPIRQTYLALFQYNSDRAPSWRSISTSNAPGRTNQRRVFLASFSTYGDWKLFAAGGRYRRPSFFPECARLPGTERRFGSSLRRRYGQAAAHPW